LTTPGKALRFVTGELPLPPTVTFALRARDTAANPCGVNIYLLLHDALIQRNNEVFVSLPLVFLQGHLCSTNSGNAGNCAAVTPSCTRCAVTPFSALS